MTENTYLTQTQLAERWQVSVLELNRGDVIQITSPTGGGFGDPMERDLAAIASEIRNGMLSTERASQVYAVVFDEHGQIDEVATAARRRERTRADTPEFTFCDERLRQDQVWPQDMRRQLAAMALTYDLSAEALTPGYARDLCQAVDITGT